MNDRILITFCVVACTNFFIYIRTHKFAINNMYLNGSMTFIKKDNFFYKIVILWTPCRYVINVTVALMTVAFKFI